VVKVKPLSYHKYLIKHHPINQKSLKNFISLKVKILLFKDSSQLPTVNYSAYDAVYHSNNNEDDDFHEAEEDEVTKRIR
jgi:hypothetical protein